MAESSTHDVLLIYHSKDSQAINALAKRLKSDGLRVWLDAWDIKPGDSIITEIDKGLEHSGVMVLCSSDQGLGSDWSQLEASSFQIRSLLTGKRRLILLVLDTTQSSFEQLHYVIWPSTNREKGYARFLDACRIMTDWTQVAQQRRTRTLRRLLELVAGLIILALLLLLWIKSHREPVADSIPPSTLAWPQEASFPWPPPRPSCMWSHRIDCTIPPCTVELENLKELHFILHNYLPGFGGRIGPSLRTDLLRIRLLLEKYMKGERVGGPSIAEVQSVHRSLDKLLAQEDHTQTESSLPDLERLHKVLLGFDEHGRKLTTFRLNDHLLAWKSSATAQELSFQVFSDVLEGYLRGVGYSDLRFMYAPGGFVIVTRIERVPLADMGLDRRSRWDVDGPPVRFEFSISGMSEAIEALFAKDLGRYRAIALVVTDTPFNTKPPPPSSTTVRNWLQDGLNRLPLEVRAYRITDNHSISVLVYEFTKSAVNGKVTFVHDSSIPALDHLAQMSIK